MTARVVSPMPLVVLISLFLFTLPGVSAASSPRINYILHCQGCHLPDGSGTPDKVPALKHSVGRFLQVPGGREYLIQVPGTAQSALSDSDVAGVLNWILENFSEDELPPQFVPYSEDEVGTYRQNPLVDVSSVRAQLMESISAP
jgi:hypothetical protein